MAEPLPLQEPKEAKRVPMEYRAQIEGRCQRQYINKPKNPPPGWRSDAQQWIDQWVERVDRKVPFQSEGLRVIEAQIDWRLISNSGVDEGFIRPVSAAGGWPIIPGSGIKGLFRRACPPERLLRWCGSSTSKNADNELKPGLLRFHGAWPSDDRWTQGLLDVAHPQQNWQVGFANDQRRNNHSAFAIASLHRPKLFVGISSGNRSIPESEWLEIEATLNQALQLGIGGRTSAGYGSSGSLQGDLLFQCSLEGQGPAAKLLDDTVEFRPTMFRAAIRGMALRLFGGITDERTALQVVGKLFGSLSRDEGQNVGLLATAYTNSSVALGAFGRGSWAQPIYATSGQLQWRLTRQCRGQEDQQLLSDLLAALHGLTMTLGGFGRGWRRPDHRIFYPNYGKTPIGCHWQWRHSQTLPTEIYVQSPTDLSRLLSHSRKLAERWLQSTGNQAAAPASWREVLHPEKMRIWSRRASGADDARAIEWFHWLPGSGDGNPDPRELKTTDLAGRVNVVGRIWNRMLPLDRAHAGVNPSSVPSSSSPIRAGGAMARPAAAMARPGPTGAMARPSTSKQAASPPQDDASISHWQGAFMETLVLFPEQRLSGPFIQELNHGAGVDFQPVSF